LFFSLINLKILYAINLKMADLYYNSNRKVGLMNQTPTIEKNEKLMKGTDGTRR